MEANGAAARAVIVGAEAGATWDTIKAAGVAGADETEVIIIGAKLAADGATMAAEVGAAIK